MTLFLRRFTLAALLCLFTTTASAHHFHYISITDTRWPENDPNDPSHDPNWVLFDAVGDAPLEEWVVYTGLDDDVSIDDSTNGYFDATGDAAAQGIWDASGFDDITNSQHTAFWELKFLDLDSLGGKTVEIGITDLVNRVRWEESEQTLSTNILPASDDVLGLPRMTDFGDFPLRFQLYYNFSNYVFTLVAINDAAGTSETFSLQGSAQPFLNFFDDGIGGTDPDNLDVYMYILCESRCEVEILDWGLLNCNIVSSAVDVDTCYNPIRSLESGLWHLISPLALDSAGNTSVGQVVGNAIRSANLDTASYGSDWIMYRSDAAQENYEVMNLADSLEVGRGYWLKTLTSDQQFKITGAENPLTPIPLVAAPNPADGRANMLGHPFGYSVCWRDVEISNDNFNTALIPLSTDPIGICDRDPADANCIMSRIMYQWNGAAYQAFDGSTPGFEGVLEAFDGFFVKVYKPGYELRVPATPGCSGSSSTLGLRTASALVAGSGRPAQLSQAGEWSIRLTVSAGQLSDPGNLLGRLSSSDDGYDVHDLDELPADLEPYLTLVFPHPEWGEQAGDYTSDFRALSSKRRGVTDWDFEVRSDQPREITLTWEILNQDLRNKSRLIDLENKLMRRPKKIEQYTVQMTGTSHRFTWRLRNGR